MDEVQNQLLLGSRWYSEGLTEPEVQGQPLSKGVPRISDISGREAYCGCSFSQAMWQICFVMCKHVSFRTALARLSVGGRS